MALLFALFSSFRDSTNLEPKFNAVCARLIAIQKVHSKSAEDDSVAMRLPDAGGWLGRATTWNNFSQRPPSTFQEMLSELAQIKMLGLSVLKEAQEQAEKGLSPERFDRLFNQLQAFQTTLGESESWFEFEAHQVYNFGQSQKHTSFTVAANAFNIDWYQALLATLRVVKLKDPLNRYKPAEHMEANIQLLEDFVKYVYSPAYAIEPWKRFTPYKIMAYIEANRESWFKNLEQVDNSVKMVIKRHKPPVNPHPIGLEWTLAVLRETGHIFVHLHQPLTTKKDFKSIKLVLNVNVGVMGLKYTYDKYYQMTKRTKKYLRMFSKTKNIIDTIALAFSEKYEAGVFTKQLVAYVRWYRLGNLRVFLKGTHKASEDLHKITYDVILGLETMHKEKVAHRDAKSKNIFLDRVTHTDGQPIIEAVWGDLDFCGDDSPEEAQRCGTLTTKAPEVNSKELYKVRPTDIWSLGCILLDLWCPSFEKPWNTKVEEKKQKEIELDREREAHEKKKKQLPIDAKEINEKILSQLAQVKAGAMAQVDAELVEGKRKLDLEIVRVIYNPGYLSETILKLQAEIKKIGLDILEAKQNILGKLTPHLDPDNPLHQIMIRCFAENPDERLDIHEVRRLYEEYLRHQFPDLAQRFGITEKHA